MFPTDLTHAMCRLIDGQASQPAPGGVGPPDEGRRRSASARQQTTLTAGALYIASRYIDYDCTEGCSIRGAADKRVKHS